MPKNIIFCADGTWDGPGGDDSSDPATNVFRLFVNLDGEDDIDSTLLANEQERNLTVDGTTVQCAKYLHGVGDSRNVLTRLLGGTVGAGLIARVVRGYTYISRNYRPGDRIFVVGFSRGAYTARALADMIAAKGLLDATQYDLEEREPAYRLGMSVWYAYRQAASPKDPNLLVRLQQVLSDLPRLFIPHDDAKLVDIEIEAVAVWDTVGALGIPEFTVKLHRVDSFQFADTKLSGKVHHGRHAIAVDERRADFTPTLWDPDDRVIQVLFPGAHSDVGGGYTTDGNQSGLSDCALTWMTGELAKLGVRFSSSPKYVARPLASGPAHGPWLNPPWNILLSRARVFPKGLCLSQCLIARCNAAAVAPRYQPENLAGYVDAGQAAAGILVV
jgi:uncharacterized protein (DUF2235 family)